MSHTVNFVAADLGASSGRLMVGRWNGRSFSLDELHRFSNGGVSLGGSLYWDALGIWSQIEAGLNRYRSRFDDALLGMGVDAWGVDYALLDRDGRLIGNPHHYRDSRTDGMPALLFERIAERDLFAETGVQTMQINTLFQLFCMAHTNDPSDDSRSLPVLLVRGEAHRIFPGNNHPNVFSVPGRLGTGDAFLSWYSGSNSLPRRTAGNGSRSGATGFFAQRRLEHAISRNRGGLPRYGERGGCHSQHGCPQRLH
jgi:hypothetical protein